MPRCDHQVPGVRQRPGQVARLAGAHVQGVREHDHREDSRGRRWTVSTRPRRFHRCASLPRRPRMRVRRPGRACRRAACAGRSAGGSAVASGIGVCAAGPRRAARMRRLTDRHRRTRPAPGRRLTEPLLISDKQATRRRPEMSSRCLKMSSAVDARRGQFQNDAGCAGRRHANPVRPSPLDRPARREPNPTPPVRIERAGARPSSAATASAAGLSAY